MTEELKSAIEQMYTTFSLYYPKPFMEGCPCCVSGADKEQIHSKPLRGLTDEDLSRYAFKAMTTWGDADDFKHFLPRIVELASTSGFIVDTFVILDKLEYGRWQEWPEPEKQEIRNFLFAWWTDSIVHRAYFDRELFTGILQLTNDMEELLRRWPHRFTDHSFYNLVDLIYNHYYEMFEKKKSVSDPDNQSLQLLHTWLKGKATILEKGFFHFADKDPAFAEKISVAQFIIEKA